RPLNSQAPHQEGSEHGAGDGCGDVSGAPRGRRGRGTRRAARSLGRARRGRGGWAGAVELWEPPRVEGPAGRRRDARLPAHVLIGGKNDQVRSRPLPVTLREPRRGRASPGAHPSSAPGPSGMWHEAPMATARYWLIKSEPSVYAYSQLEADGETDWTGV